MEAIDRLAGSRTQADMRAAIGGDRRHIGATVDPEFGVFLAIADRRAGPFTQLAHPERCQQRFVEPRARGNIAHANGNVVDHSSLLSSPRKRGPIRRAAKIGCGVWVPARARIARLAGTTDYLTPAPSTSPACRRSNPSAPGTRRR